ncbi:hypothetical protein V2G26_008640 [Clonostachys chloroleuca]
MPDGRGKRERRDVDTLLSTYEVIVRRHLLCRGIRLGAKIFALSERPDGCTFTLLEGGILARDWPGTHLARATGATGGMAGANPGKDTQ